MFTQRTVYFAYDPPRLTVPTDPFEMLAIKYRLTEELRAIHTVYTLSTIYNGTFKEISKG